MTAAPPPGVPSSPAASDPEGHRSIYSYLNLALRRRSLLVLLPLCAGLLAGVLSILSHRQYLASASFIPQEPASAPTGLIGLATQIGLAPGHVNTGSPQFYESLLQSRGVLSDVLTAQYAVGGENPFKGNLFAYLKIRPDTGDRAVLLGIRALKNSMTVSSDRITGVVRLEVKTTNPLLSAQVARRVLDLVNDYNLRRRQSQGRIEREFVEQRLAVAQRELSDAEDALAAFYRRNRQYGAPDLQAEVARLQRQVALRQQLYVSLAQSRETATLDEARNTPVITVIESPEGFVEPVKRGTLTKAIVAAFVGLLLAGLLIFGAPALERMRQGGGPDYDEYLRLRAEVRSELRALLRRRQ